MRITIENQNDNKAIPDVSGMLQNTVNNTISYHAISDSQGEINFGNVSDGNYNLNISCVGYEPFFVSIPISNNHGANLPDTIMLTPSYNKLNTVTVTSSSAKPFIQFSANNITLNVASSPIASTGNAYDALKHGPGIMEVNDALSFRGKSITVLINGRPSNLSGDELKQLLENTPASNIEKFEIIPTPTAKYDANAQTIVNIVFVKNPFEGLNGTLVGGIGGGVHLKYTGGIDLNYRKKNFNIYGSYNYEHNSTFINTNSDRILSSTDHILEDSHETRTRNNHAFKLGLDYDINKNNSVGFLISGYDNLRGRVSSDNVTLTHAAPTPDSFSTVALKGHANFFNPDVNIYYKAKLDTTGKTLTINGDYMNYHQKWNDDFITNFFDVNHNQYQVPYYQKDSTPANDNIYSFSIDYENPIKNGNIQAGLKTTHTVVDGYPYWQYLSGNDWLVEPTYTNHFVYKEDVNAGYVNLDKTWGKYELNAGLRVEHTHTQGDQKTTNQINDTSYWGFFPTIVISYAKNDNNVFSLSYHKTVSRASYDMINPFIIYQSQYSFAEGNPHLLPQYEHDVNFTYTYKQSWSFGADYVLGRNSFASILINGGNASVGSTFGNIRKQESIVPFINWTSTVAKIWNINFSNTGEYTSYSQKDLNGYNLQNNGWTYLGQLQNLFKIGAGISAEINMMYRSSIPYGTYRVKPTFETDFGIQKTLMHGNGKLALSTTDIFNTSTSNYIVNFMDVNQIVHQKAESRFVMLQFTYRFGNKNVKPKKERESTIDDLRKRLEN